MRRKCLFGSLAAVGLGSLAALAGSASWDFTVDPTDPTEVPHPIILLGSTVAGGASGGGEWINWDYGSDGTTIGFLSISGPSPGTWSKIIFPDIDNGVTIAAFTFECMLRVGNGTASPADGFSISYARANDPTFTKDANGNYQAGGWSGTANEPGSVGGSMAGLAEEGTITGLSIGFDAWNSNSELWPLDLNAGLFDVVGLSVRVDNKIVAQVSLPTLNGACEDNTSLQTGPQGTSSPDDWTVLCWQPFKIQLTEDKHLSVWWKGRAVVDNLAVDFNPSPGRLVFGGRTGDAYQNTHVDDIVLTTIPADKPLITTASADAISVSIQLEDAGAVTVKQDTVKMKVNGADATPLTFTKTGTTTTARWASPTYLASGSTVTVDVEFMDSSDRTITGTRTAVVAAYNHLPAAYQVPTESVDTGKPGFLIRPYQTEALQPNTLWWTEEQLAGLRGDNIADLTGATGGFYTHEGVINFNVAAPAAVGNFNVDNGFEDMMFPGIPGTTGLTGSSTEEMLAYIEFPTAGMYQLGVNSDDGFRVSVGTAPGDLTGLILGQYDGGRGASDTIFTIVVDPPGIYPIRLVWENGAGELPGNGANCEFFSVKDGVKTLINDVANGGLKAYRESSATAPWISKIRPLRGEAVLPDPVITAEITHGASPVNDGSVKVKLNGAETAADVVSAGGKTTVTIPRPADFLPAGTYTVTIDLTDSATPAKAYTFQWQFTVGDYQVYQAPYGAGGTWNVYLVTRGAKNWVAAEMAAKASVEPFSGQKKPGHLVTLHSAEERDFVRMIATGESVWIGLTDNELYGGFESGTDGSVGWVWVTGEEYTWYEWNAGEPNDYPPGEDAAELIGSGLFNDNSSGIPPEGSGTTRFYVVEYETRASAKLANIRPGLFPDGPLPGPEASCGAFAIRAVRDVGNVGNIATAFNALYNANASIVDTTSPVVNFNDPGGAGGPGIFRAELTFPGDRDGDDNDFVISATTKIRITEAGLYTFGVHSDDGFALRIRGKNWVSVSGNGQFAPGGTDTITYQFGTGDSNTRGVIDLEVGEYDLDFVFFEDGGGAFVELYAAKGEYANDADAEKWQLVGVNNLLVPGVSDAGWTVAYSQPGGTALNSIADAEAELVGAPTVTGVPKIQYADPDAAGGTQAGYLPFPNDTPADDNDFAILGEAQLVIPADGTYYFGFQGDDGGYLQIVGQTWDRIVATANASLGIINGDRIQFDANTGDSYTVGAITLAQGTYTIRTLFWERGGGAYHWVFGSAPNDVHFPGSVLSANAATVGTWPLEIVPCAGKPEITVTKNTDGTITISWTNGGTLQAATSILGPWQDVTDTSPYTFTPQADVPYMFGRVKK
ncbi:MAG TPA: lectin-like protein [Verrucomicrobiota bacterium]|nr:lectin-like protein [Verrucomicrobiota bacterium]HQF59239.1 lectin-like protein [Verrucomicrobiota bacterium]